MLKWEAYERLWFVLAFIAGLVLCFILPPLFREYACALSQQNTIRTEQHDGSGKQQKGPKVLVQENKTQPANQRNYRTATLKNEYSAKSVVCGEMKLTDLALIFFTYCLFMVGIFAMRGSKHTVEELQRAHLWPGFGDHDPVTNGMKWFITVANSGQTAGVIKEINYFIELEEVYRSGKGDLKQFYEREDVILPSPPNTKGNKTGCDFVIDQPKICWGWIEYEDVFGRIWKRGWKHRLRLTADAAGNHSNPLVGCYSQSYQPWLESRARKKSNIIQISPQGAFASACRGRVGA
jgi:hypothetical protein